MTKKLIVMQKDPELFKKFQETVGRSRRLMATVNLCDEKVELVLLETDQSGVHMLMKLDGYDDVTLQTLTNLLNSRAAVLKDHWMPQYAKLAESEVRGVRIDLNHMDYAELIVGDDPTTERHYRMNWCFEDVVATAEFISDRCNPSPAVLERFQKHQM